MVEDHNKVVFCPKYEFTDVRFSTITGDSKLLIFDNFWPKNVYLGMKNTVFRRIFGNLRGDIRFCCGMKFKPVNLKQMIIIRLCFTENMSF